MTSHFRSWVEQKLAIAQCLADGACGASYAEACLVISSVISAIAADLWPGDRIDRRRFTEVWAIHTPPPLGANRISLPLLISYLDGAGRHREADLLRASNQSVLHPISTLVFTGDLVDLPEKQVLALCPNITTLQARRYSYGVVFYEHVRSAFVHEYQIGEQAGRYPMARPGSGVSYINRLDGGVVVRKIHFEVAWLIRLVRELALSLEPLWEMHPHTPPSSWWVDG